MHAVLDAVSVTFVKSMARRFLLGGAWRSEDTQDQRSALFRVEDIDAADSDADVSKLGPGRDWPAVWSAPPRLGGARFARPVQRRGDPAPVGQRCMKSEACSFADGHHTACNKRRVVERARSGGSEQADEADAKEPLVTQPVSKAAGGVGARRLRERGSSAPSRGRSRSRR